MCVICDSLATTQANGLDPSMTMAHPLGPLVDALVSDYAWTDTTLTFSFAPEGTTTIDGGYSGGSATTSAFTAAMMQDVRDAFAHVSTFLNLTFVEVAFSAASNFRFQSVEAVPGGWAGYAYYPNNFSGSDLIIRDDLYDPASGNTLIHELGHSLGLEHTHNGTTVFPGVDSSSDPGDFGLNSELFSTMSYRGASDPMNPGLTIGGPRPGFAAIDIAALQATYGANTTNASGATVYQARSGLQAIWDTGGVDAIDFSSATQDAVIDLRAATLQVAEGGGGYLSYVRNGASSAAGGYTIANGVVIENGTTGSGNDRLTGNDAANTLNGGMGNDTLTGGLGADVLHGSAAGAVPDTLDLVNINSPTVRNQALSVQDYTEMPGSMTLDMVVQLDAGVTHHQRLVSYKADASGAVGFDLQVWDTSSPYVYLIVKTSGGFSTLWTGISRDDVVDGEVHRITLSRDAGTGTYRVYLDGTYEGGGVDKAGEAFAAGGRLVFGQSQGLWGGANDPAYATEGAFGDIAMYNAVLSDADIAARSVTDLADTGDGRLVSYWRPDAATGTVADVTGGSGLALENAPAITTLNLTSDNDLLDGGSGNDSLFGGFGHDTLIGGGGADLLVGGDGDDLYTVDALDTVTEAANAGIDTVRSAASHTLGANVEHLVLFGTAAVNGTGNAAANHITGNAAANILTGLGGADTLEGGRGNDTYIVDALDTIIETASGGIDTVRSAATYALGQYLDHLVLTGTAPVNGTGNGLANHITGNSGANRLIGGAGVDTLEGGDGNDLYITDGADVITETAGGGVDLVRASGSITLAAHLETLVLVGTSALNGTGNAGANRITGNTGNNVLNGRSGVDTLIGGGGDDVLIGGAGNDILTGGVGADDFHFGTGGGTDTVTDFQNGQDRLVIGAGATGFGDLSITMVAANTRIAFSDVLIVLRDVESTLIDATDFLFI